MAAPIKITLDTNCVINSFDLESQTATSVDALTYLRELHDSGEIEIAVTTRVEADLSTDSIKERAAKIIDEIAELPKIGTAGKWGVSKWGGGDFYMGKTASDELNAIQTLLFPNLSKDDKHYQNKSYDADHLYGHTQHHRDIFVTDDKGIIKKRGPLKEQHSIVVMTPTECVEFLYSTL